MFVAVSIIGVLLNIFAYPILNRWNEGACMSCVTGNVNLLTVHSVLVYTQRRCYQHCASFYVSED